MRHAALYIRVSTDAQFEEGYSVDAQKEMLAAYCTARGIASYEYYIDGGFTGSNIERPQMLRLVEDAKKARVTDVIVYKLDRLSRSQKDTMFLIEDVFIPNNVAFTSISENFDTSTAFGMAMVGMLSVFAQFERDNINRRTKMGMTERVKTGLWMGGGRTPFGYDYDKETGTLVPNTDAKTVLSAYELLIAGHSPERIAVMLGLKYDKIVRDILARKTYTGVIVYNGREYAGKHKAIISTELYEQAQRALAARSGRRAHDSRKLLSGLVYCGKCGARMRYQKWGKAGDKLTCYSQQKSKQYLVRDPNCDNEKAWAEDVEYIVVDAILKRSMKARTESEQQSPEKSALDVLNGQLVSHKRKLSRLYGLYSDGDDTLLEEITRQKDAIDRVEREIEREREAGSIAKEIAKKRERIKDVKELWPLLSGADRRKLVLLFVDRVTVTNSSVDIDFSI